MYINHLDEGYDPRLNGLADIFQPGTGVHKPHQIFTSHPTCVSARCGELWIANGYIDQTYPEGGLATYYCDEAFRLTGGDAQRTCLDGGSWDGQEPFCVCE